MVLKTSLKRQKLSYSQQCFWEKKDLSMCFHHMINSVNCEASVSLAKRTFAANCEVIIPFFQSQLGRTQFHLSPFTYSFLTYKSKQKHNSTSLFRPWLQTDQGQRAKIRSAGIKCIYKQELSSPKFKVFLMIVYSSKQSGYYPTNHSFLYQQWSLRRRLKERTYSFVQMKGLVSMPPFSHIASHYQSY